LFPVPGSLVHRSYAVTGDGRFLIAKPVDENMSDSVTWVLNWLAEPTQRVPSR